MMRTCARSEATTAIVMQVLVEERRAAAPVGRAALAVLLFQDILVAPILILVGFLGREGASLGAALFEATHDRPEDLEVLQPVVEEWERDAVESFMTGYRGAIEGCPSYPAEAADAEALLDLFLIEKAAYEIAYEAANRPTWVRIPLEGIRRILAPSP